MTFHFNITPRLLHFKQPAGTSRGVYLTRQSWFVEVSSPELPGRKGIGECAPLPKLSCDDVPHYAETLQRMCEKVAGKGTINYDLLRAYPSMLFGIETALLSLQRNGNVLFDTAFGRGEKGIPINGLVWMGTHDEMMARLEEKLDAGFRCVKLKIGAIDFEEELDLIKHIRHRFSKEDVELRVDANGGFTPQNAMQRLEQLAVYDIHSIEQPIGQGQWTEMARLCANSPLPIALDEELIGVNSIAEKKHLLDTVAPAFIVLKPSLHGGMHGAKEWVALAKERGIGSWVTSALESNIGLNAIAHFTAHLYHDKCDMPQGLGTGLLFTDNIPMPLEIRKDALWYCKNL